MDSMLNEIRLGFISTFTLLSQRFSSDSSQVARFSTLKGENYYLHNCDFDLSELSESKPDSIYPLFIIDLLFIKHFIYAGTGEIQSESNRQETWLH